MATTAAMRKTRSMAKPPWLRRRRVRRMRGRSLRVAVPAGVRRLCGTATGGILRDYDLTGLLVLGVVQRDGVGADADEFPAGLQGLAFVEEDDFLAFKEEGCGLVVDLLRRKAVVLDARWRLERRWR